MSTIQELPKVEDWCLQKCPICQRENYMVVLGDTEVCGVHKIFPDMGYSFCNCYNIFYTTHLKYGNPIDELQYAFSRLGIDDEVCVTMADPFFINWDNPYEFIHWKIRKNFVIWDIDSLCDVIEKIGFKIVGRYREFNPNSVNAQTTTILFGIEEKTPRSSVQAANALFGNKEISAVEIGTHTGRNAESMVKHINNLGSLTLIDLWKAYSDFPIQEWQDQDYQIVLDKFKNNSKVKVIRDDSSRSASRFEDASFDFVYIDAAHDYESVKKDVLAWLPKVKKGGIIAGHDYLYYATPDVKQAVDEIFGVENVHNGKNFNSIHDWWVYV